MKRFIIAFVFILLSFNYLQAQQASVTQEVAVETGYLDVDGGKLYYESAGKGETIVLIHDGMVHSVIWDRQFAEFAKDHKVVRYDRRGYGRSSVPQAPYSNIEDLNQLFILKGIERATLIGMSAGGGLVIDFTLKYPEKVSAIVLVGAVVSGFGYTSHMTSRGGHFDYQSPKYTEPGNFIRYFGWEDPYEVYSQNITAKEKLLKILEANPQNTDRTRGRFERYADRPAVKFLSEIKVPSLILTGEYDIPDVHAHSGAISAGITGSRREVISNAGHLIPLEQPEVFNQTVLKFLDHNEFISLLTNNSVTEAVEYCRGRINSGSGTGFINENEINNLGYQCLNLNRLTEAKELFNLNIQAFPGSANVYDSMGEACMNEGQTDLAIKYYEKSVELNPDNTNAIDRLKILKRDLKASGSTILLRKPESIIFDKVHNRYLFSSYETGSIMQVDSKGRQSILVDSQNAIQGLEIIGNVVYVGAGTSVRGFDLKTGELVMDVKIDSVSNINDITADEDGHIYAGDVFGTKIIKVNTKNNTYSIFVEGNGIDHPNGIFYDRKNKRILVCSFRANSPIQAVNLADSTVTTLANTNLNNCDGIVLDKYGRCYVTSWETSSIYVFDRDFSDPPTLFYTNSCPPADISYDSVHDAIAIPLMTCNSYEIVPIKPLKK